MALRSEAACETVPETNGFGEPLDPERPCPPSAAAAAPRRGILRDEGQVQDGKVAGFRWGCLRQAGTVNVSRASAAEG